jgi:hypothetical protein
LKAAKNWHQNRGAKRLDSIIGGGIPALLQSSRTLAQAKKQAALRPPEPFPLIRVQGRAFSSYESTTIAPKARPREMLMTTQNSVSHMTYLLEPGCKRRLSLARKTRQSGWRSKLFLEIGFASEFDGIG